MRSYLHKDKIHTIVPRIVPDGVLVTVYSGDLKRFTRLFAGQGSTPAQAHDIARNMALNPLRVPIKRGMAVRGGLQPQIWGVDLGGAINKNFFGR